MKSISNILGEAKIKILRLFIFNPTASFTPKQVSNRAKENSATTNKELRLMEKGGLIKRRAKGYSLDTTYPYLPALEDFLVDVTPITFQEIAKRVYRLGHIRLLLAAGLFLHDRDARLDLLVVGDRISQAKLRSVVASIEAELGKELRYAVFETPDFQYRMSIYDKLIKDIFESHHEKIINKLGIQ